MFSPHDITIARATMVAFAASLATLVLHASAASALSFSIDGTDPVATGCANSAVTVASKPIQAGLVDVGDLQLRWSPQCETNWGRFVATTIKGRPVEDVVSVWVYRQADNKWCGDQKGTGCKAAWWNTMNAGTIYSNQLYGCGYKTLARVEVADFYNNGDPAYFSTPLVGGC